MEGTIVTRRFRWVCWDLDPALRVARDGDATQGSRDWAKRVASPPPPRVGFLPNDAVWSCFSSAYLIVALWWSGSWMTVVDEEWERKRDDRRKKARKKERESGWLGIDRQRGTTGYHQRRHRKRGGGCRWRRRSWRRELLLSPLLTRLASPIVLFNFFFYLGKKLPFSPFIKKEKFPIYP